MEDCKSVSNYEEQQITYKDLRDYKAGRAFRLFALFQLHFFEEVSDLYKSGGITEIWGCNDDRRGFGICGKFLLKRKKAVPTRLEHRNALVEIY